jgi:hypothetical protein
LASAYFLWCMIFRSWYPILSDSKENSLVTNTLKSSLVRWIVGLIFLYVGAS